LFLGEHGLWFDEALTVWAARLPLGEFVDTVGRRSANLGLYYTMMRGWTVVGTGELWLRLSSVVAALATIPVMFAVGRRLFDARAGAMAAVLLAAHPLFIAHAREARYYALLSLLGAGASLALLRALDRRRGWAWALYGSLATLLVYTHVAGSLVLIAHAAALLLRPRSATPWRSMFLTGVAVAVACVPLGIATLSQGADLVSWLPDLSRRAVTRFSLEMSAMHGHRVSFVLAVLYVAIVVWAATRLLRAPEGERWRVGFALSWLIVPVVLGVVVSWWRPILLARYFAGVLPALVLLAGYAVSRVRLTAVRAVALGVFLALDAVVLASLYGQGPREDWRGAMEYLSGEARGGEVVFVSGSWGVPPDLQLPLVSPGYYAERLGLRAELASVRELPGALSAAPVSRLWVITSAQSEYTPRFAELTTTLEVAGYRLGEARWFHGEFPEPIVVAAFVTP
jgi:mannosyltransferase